MKIIFAQGNPEPRYSGTRHNVGFAVLNELAHNLNLKWEDRPKFSAHTAEATIAGEKVLLVKPTTYYNETGLSARKIIDFYKLDPTADLIVIHDDLALEFGIIRVRQGGRDAG
ncbi:peptidyl-tRNA hydrolase, partial [Candidatus Saccharibacteria bacterium]|nr:peptidyl-tRNA hydrolase [Candidatus Saccharibacteria bacterium]